MANDSTKFVSGLRAFSPRQGAPEFVKGAAIINRDELAAWLKDQPAEIRLDLKESKDGKYYFQVNDYKKPEEATNYAPTASNTRNNQPEDMGEDLPF